MKNKTGSLQITFIRKHVLLFLFSCINIITYAQDWTWIKGDNILDQPSVFGIKGFAAASNKPGTREGARSWKDASGNLWMFSGAYVSNNQAQFTNEIWKYDPTTSQWTWINGDTISNQFGNYGTLNVQSITNKPGTRESAVSWTDASGNFYLFGGYGLASNGSYGFLSDLWKYDIAANQWTWIHGNNINDQNGVYGTLGTAAATNKPGGRYGAVAWTDASGNFWMFSGCGYPAAGNGGFLNDLWKYNPTTNQWTWIKGSSVTSQITNYGTINVASASNNPGARRCSASWKDAAGNFWLFGGDGYASTTAQAELNDLWKYDPSINQWTWIKGDNIVSQYTVHGTLGVSAPTNKPGGRYFSMCWSDSANDLWLFGGHGYDASNGSGQLNDLWRYHIATNEWTWMKGSNYYAQTGTYGTQSVVSVSNTPGGRAAGVTWTDNNFLWLFGGTGKASLQNYDGLLNDLWRYKVCNAPAIPVNVTSTANLIKCAGTSATLSATGTGTLNWFASSTSTTILGSGSSFVTPSLNAGTYTYYVEAAGICTVSPLRTPVTITVNALPLLSVNSGTICSGNSFTLNPSGALSYTFSGGSAIVSPTVNTSYSVTGTNLAGCVNTVIAVSNITVMALPLPTISLNSGSICAGSSFTITPSGANTYTFLNGSTNVTPTITTTYSVIGKSTAGCLSASPGSGTVTVIPLPVITAGNAAICAGDSYTIIPSGAATYTYSGGSAVVSPPISAIYAISGSNSFGCVSANPSIINITVNPLPTISVNNGSVCLGNSFTINPSGGSSYTITGGNTIVSPTLTTSYSVTGTSAAGCAATNTAISNVTVVALPLPTVMVNSGIICAGNSFTIIPSGAITYTFSGGSAIVSPTNTTSYSVTGTDAAGCSGSAAAISVVTVNPLPVITLFSTDSLLCIGETCTLSANGALSYTWSSGGNQVNEIISPTLTTTYSVTAQDNNGCLNTAVITQSVDACLGIKQYTESTGITVFPNPFKDVFTLYLKDLTVNYNVQITNSFGQLIIEKKIISDTTTVDLKNELSGVYFVKIITGHLIIHSARIIKE